MVGTSRKLGRVGAIRRSITKPPIRRPSEKKDRVSPLTDVVETLKIVRETQPLNFAMPIKLTPEILEELKRVEAQGLSARVKFSANSGADGNVFSVGDKNFNFTWSTETPVLCDIYEERQSGKGGDGLLVESGSAFRKLSVQRVLDESTQKHVKMRSEEAERRLKSRRAIVLGPRNSSANQMKALAVAESVVPHKPTYIPGLSITTPSKSKSLSCSPLSSQPQHHGAPTSQISSGNIVKGTERDVATTHSLTKISIANVVDVDKGSSLDNHETASSAANLLVPTPESREPVEEINCYSAGHHEDQEIPSKGGYNQHSDDKHCDEGPHNHTRKMLNGKSSSEFVCGTTNLPVGKSTNTSSPDEALQQLNLGPTNQNACNNNSIPLQKKGVEWQNEVGLPSERSLTIFSSECVADKIATSKGSRYRNKEMHGKPMVSSGSSRKKHSENVVAGARNMTPPDSGVPDRSSKRKKPNYHVDDHIIAHKRATAPQTRLHQSSVHNKVSETCSKSKYAETGTDQEAIPEVVSLPANEIKKHKNVELCDSNRQKDTFLIVSIGESYRSIESSPDRNNPYIKYEKNEAELKDPIKDATQYRAYVKEYQEKYESYCSLNKILESYRDEFSNIGKDLKTYKDTDMKKYHEIMGQIKSSFRQHGEKHKRLKKIFVVLSKELKHLKQLIKDYAAPHIKG